MASAHLFRLVTGYPEGHSGITVGGSHHQQAHISSLCQTNALMFIMCKCKKPIFLVFAGHVASKSRITLDLSFLVLYPGV